jgi:hypothetical protein
MPIDIELNLRVPSLMMRSPDKADQKIDNSSVRFLKRMTVDSVPKPGDKLQLTVRSTAPFECSTTRSDWSDDKELFVVAGQFARRSITPEEYQAILNDPDWTQKLLP